VSFFSFTRLSGEGKDEWMLTVSSMRFATLKPFGNPKAADNWDVYKTPDVTILGKYDQVGN
jgi:hypothetical protein